jgi:hypothetical protein
MSGHWQRVENEQSSDMAGDEPKWPDGRLRSSNKNGYLHPELGTRSFFRGSLSAPHSIFSPGSLTLMRSFLEFPFSLVAPTLVAQPVVR